MTEERQELHLKFRPRTFEEMLGNEALKESVLSVLDRTRLFLFYGPRGCGKTTLARLIAKKIGAADLDIKEIDAADNTGVDYARSLKGSAQYSPMAGKFKVFIIDECHRLSGAASDSLLKTLEEPPKHCYFIFCTTDLSKVPTTIKSRAKCYEVKPLTEEEQKALIRRVCVEEGFRLSPAVRQSIMESCDGVPREIIISIDTVRDIQDDGRAIALINMFVHREVKELCQALLNRKPWKETAAILKELKDDPEKIRYAVLGYMNSVLLSGNPASCDSAALIIEMLRESVMYSGKAGLTYACYMVLK